MNNVGDLSRVVLINLGQQITLTIQHDDGTKADVKVVPRWKPPAGQTSTGTVSQDVDYTVVKESLPFWKAIPTGSRAVIDTLSLYKNGIIGMIIGTIPFVPTGPVGIVQVTGEVAHAGISPLLELTSFISIAIAITQIIPFPSLDGSRMAFVIVEWVRRGKRISPRIENIVHSVGFIILIAILVLITYQDIVRWITGGSLLK
jgi:regulator of sigma E protease